MKLATLVVNVPIKKAGNQIYQEEVSFDIYNKEENNYQAFPLLDENERRLANLPESLDFFREDGKVKSVRGIKDGNLHIIQSIADLLSEKQLW